MSRVEGTMSRVEGNNSFQKEQNTLLDNRFLKMSDCLGTSSALLTTHHDSKKCRKKKSLKN